MHTSSYDPKDQISCNSDPQQSKTRVVGRLRSSRSEEPATTPHACHRLPPARGLHASHGPFPPPGDAWGNNHAESHVLIAAIGKMLHSREELVMDPVSNQHPETSQISLSLFQQVNRKISR